MLIAGLRLKLHPTDACEIESSNYLPNTLVNSPVYWRQEDSIDNGDHFWIKNGNIHGELRPKPL